MLGLAAVHCIRSLITIENENTTNTVTTTTIVI